MNYQNRKTFNNNIITLIFILKIACVILQTRVNKTIEGCLLTALFKTVNKTKWDYPNIHQEGTV